jgi:hypothetical protein
MKRRNELLTGIMLSGLAVAALPQLSFAQTDAFAGVWQLNLAKSRYSPARRRRAAPCTFTGKDKIAGTVRWQSTRRGTRWQACLLTFMMGSLIQ